MTTSTQIPSALQATGLGEVALHDALALRGYTTVPVSRAENLFERALKLAKALGEAKPPKLGAPTVNELRFRTECSHPLSMSAQFVDGNFPLHTDTAHWPTPCRYVLLFTVGNERHIRPTIILDLSPLLDADDLHHLACGVWRTRISPHLVIPVAQRREARWAFRWDAGILEPISARAKIAHGIIPKVLMTARPVAVQWEQPQILVLDNWRVLHSRDAVPRTTDQDRRLWRILIAERR